MEKNKSTSLKSQTKSKRSKPYVDNDRLYKDICWYLEKYKEFKDGIGEEPRIPEYIGESFYKIAIKVSKFPSFRDYIFVDELISISILNCLNYIKTFNPEKSKNPFSYFTQTIFNSFIQEIKKQKRYLSLKNKAIMNFEIDNLVDSGYSSINTASIEQELRSKLNEYFRTHEDYQEETDLSRKKK